MAPARALEFPLLADTPAKPRVGTVEVPLTLTPRPAAPGAAAVPVDVGVGSPDVHVTHEHDGCAETRQVQVYVDGPHAPVFLGTLDVCDEGLPDAAAPSARPEPSQEDQC